MTKTNFKEGYVSVNGLEMYYEIHGTGQPLVLLHGAFSAIGTSFGELLPELAKTRQVIAFELQAHGHTADIDRPLSLEGMADDTAAVGEVSAWEDGGWRKPRSAARERKRWCPPWTPPDTGRSPGCMRSRPIRARWRGRRQPRSR